MAEKLPGPAVTCTLPLLSSFRCEGAARLATVPAGMGDPARDIVVTCAQQAQSPEPRRRGIAAAYQGRPSNEDTVGSVHEIHARVNTYWRRRHSLSSTTPVARAAPAARLSWRVPREGDFFAASDSSNGQSHPPRRLRLRVAGFKAAPRLNEFLLLALLLPAICHFVPVACQTGKLLDVTPRRATTLTCAFFCTNFGSS